MAAVPYYTSTTLIEAVKRKISFPTYQSTFSPEDILAFANEEMQISQVPAILEYHQDYFVFYKDLELVQTSSRYPIPSRAIGMKLRDAVYVDDNNNIFEMTRVMAGDKTFFNGNIAGGTNVHKFYTEGNDIVLAPELYSAPTGSIRLFFFLRPNQLVPNERAAIIQNFRKTLTITNNASIISQESVIVVNGITFVPVSSSPGPNEFLIGVDATATAANIATVMNTYFGQSIVSSSVTNTLSLLSFQNVINITFSDTTSYTMPTTQELLCTASIPSNILENSLVDLLQTNPGHRTYRYDVRVPSGGVSGSSIFIQDSDLLPNTQASSSSITNITMVVGDYVATANECIIPQIPPDLHNGLAERTCARILEALGDQAGLQSINAKIQNIEQREGNLLDDRVEGSALKINGRHSLLRYLGIGSRRRF